MFNNCIPTLLYAIRLTVCVTCVYISANSFAYARAHHKEIPVALPVYCKPTDPNSPSLSPAGVQMAQLLKIEEPLRRLEQMRQQFHSGANTKAGNTKSYIETRQDYLELKLDMIAAIEQARLDIDFVIAEMEDEHARTTELYLACSEERIRRINRANINAFRTNGVLWAAAEGLSIPTYKQPKYSIPSGTLGIIAGLVPSIFSLYAVRVPQEHYAHSSYPNLLCKFFDYPTTPRIEYPDAVWAFLSATPMGEHIKSRREIMTEHWRSNRNVRCFQHGHDKPVLDALTGTKQGNITEDLLADQLFMLRELKAVVLQMNRPLMELMMLVRGQKEF